MLVTWYVDWNKRFLTYFAKHPVKKICLFFVYIVIVYISKISRARIHYDVNVTS